MRCLLRTQSGARFASRNTESRDVRGRMSSALAREPILRAALVTAVIIEATTRDGQHVTITIPPVPDIDAVLETNR